MDYLIGFILGVLGTIALGVFTNIITSPTEKLLRKFKSLINTRNISVRRKSVTELIETRRAFIELRSNINRDDMFILFANSVSFALSLLIASLISFIIVFLFISIIEYNDKSILLFYGMPIFMLFIGFIRAARLNTYFSALHGEDFIKKHDEEIIKLAARLPLEEKLQIEKELADEIPNLFFTKQ